MTAPRERERWMDGSMPLQAAAAKERRMRTYRVGAGTKPEPAADREESTEAIGHEPKQPRGAVVL
jgi:hypothetical protein